MRFSFLLFVVLVGFVAFSRVSAEPGEAHYEALLEVNQTFSAFMGTLPTPVSGSVFVTLTTAYSVEVCLQEYIILQGNLSSCNPGGYFLFYRNSSAFQTNFFSLDEDSISSMFGGYYESNFVGEDLRTETQNTTLRSGSTYFVSMRLVGTTLSNATASFDLTVTWNPVPCGPNQVGLPSGCVDSPPTQVSAPSQVAIKSKATLYFSVDLTPDDNRFLKTSATINNAAITLAPGADNDTLSLAIRREAAPVGDLADAFSSAEANDTYSLELDSPVPGTTYYIQVINNGNSDLEITLLTVSEGCTSGFGPNCTSNTTDLTGNPNATLFTGIGDYQYFFVRNATLVVGVGTEKLQQTAPALLASIFNYPANGSALIASSSQTVNFISAFNPGAGSFEDDDVTSKWFVSVWANDGQEYYLWANTACPNNCAGSSGGNVTHGVCDVNTGMCDCDKGYGNLFCDKTGLKLVWIIIIVIVCAIILAVAIGVPVACFLRNRRRARYERV